jgi:hypothetical protein
LQSKCRHWDVALSAHRRFAEPWIAEPVRVAIRFVVNVMRKHADSISGTPSSDVRSSVK